MANLILVLAASAALYGLHRLALWMEARGWIYYQRTRGSSGSLGAAFLEIQTVLEPSQRHVLEIRRKDDSDRSDSSDPPSPSPSSGPPHMALGRDVIATLGPDHLEVVRSAARHHRQFTDESAEYFELVVGDVPQHFHDCFIDTSWPACPAHPRHPMWYAGGWWVADGQPFARLGELESALGPTRL